MPSILKKLGTWTVALEMETLACAGIAAGFLVGGMLFLAEFARAAEPLVR